jgi:hypothetical protein
MHAFFTPFNINGVGSRTQSVEPKIALFLIAWELGINVRGNVTRDPKRSRNHRLVSPLFLNVFHELISLLGAISKKFKICDGIL